MGGCTINTVYACSLSASSGHALSAAAPHQHQKSIANRAKVVNVCLSLRKTAVASDYASSSAWCASLCDGEMGGLGGVLEQASAAISALYQM